MRSRCAGRELRNAEVLEPFRGVDFGRADDPNAGRECQSTPRYHSDRVRAVVPRSALWGASCWSSRGDVGDRRVGRGRDRTSAAGPLHRQRGRCAGLRCEVDLHRNLVGRIAGVVGVSRVRPTVRLPVPASRSRAARVPNLLPTAVPVAISGSETQAEEPAQVHLTPDPNGELSFTFDQKGCRWKPTEWPPRIGHFRTLMLTGLRLHSLVTGFVLTLQRASVLEWQ